MCFCCCQLGYGFQTPIGYYMYCLEVRICLAFNREAYPTEDIKTNCHAHQKLKENAGEAKRLDKDAAVKNNKISCNLDMEQVLLSPSDPTNNALFCKRRPIHLPIFLLHT